GELATTTSTVKVATLGASRAAPWSASSLQPVYFGSLLPTRARRSSSHDARADVARPSASSHTATLRRLPSPEGKREYAFWKRGSASAQLPWARRSRPCSKSSFAFSASAPESARAIRGAAPAATAASSRTGGSDETLNAMHLS